MDRKQIIDEGLLELYLLGELSLEEEQKVVALIAKDKDLRTIFNDLELAFEKLGMENAITPPEKVREQLKTKLGKPYIASRSEQKNSPALEGKKYSTKFLVAASIAIVFALSSIWLYSKWRQSLETLNFLQSQTVILEERLSQLENNYQLTSTKYNAINNPQIIPLVLNGNDRSPGSKVVFFVNHQNKTVLVNAQGLSPLDAENSYQLWADVEGEMINMGLLSTEEDLIPAIYISKAESFNITIEPAGGNNHPTVKNLIGNVYL